MYSLESLPDSNARRKSPHVHRLLRLVALAQTHAPTLRGRSAVAAGAAGRRQGERVSSKQVHRHRAHLLCVGGHAVDVAIVGDDAAVPLPVAAERAAQCRHLASRRVDLQHRVGIAGQAVDVAVRLFRDRTEQKVIA